jgi:hypothetical protein
MLSGFTEWSRREPSDIDGRVTGPSERERMSQTPYNFLPVRARCPLDLTARMAVLLVAHAPDGLVAVFANKQAAVFCDSDSNRATPDFAIGRDEAGDKVFIFAARFAG